MTNRGFTLVELLIVITIISVLAIALGFSYVGWQGAYKVEQTTKDIYTDLMDARTRAMTRSRTYFAVINADSYSIIEDANNNTLNDDAALPTFPKRVEYALNENINGNTITFNTRGITTNLGSIWLTTTVAADYDCIVIANMRINLGQWNGASCDPK